jgi:hypothetical protein
MIIYCIDLGETASPRYSYAYIHYDNRFLESFGFQTRQTNMKPNEFSSHFGNDAIIQMVDSNGRLFNQNYDKN